MGRPVGQTVAQLRQIVEIVHQNCGHDQPLPWPTTGRIVSDYDCPGLMGMVNPTLFPYGVGDVTKKVVVLP